MLLFFGTYRTSYRSIEILDIVLAAETNVTRKK